MEPEEQLEYMISMRQRGEEASRVVSAEISSRLAVVEVLDQLGRIEAPPEFATRLEEDLRGHILNTLIKRGTIGPGQAAVPTGMHASRKRRSPSSPRHHFATRRAWMITLGVAAVLLLACVTLITDFAQHLPGSPLSKPQQSEQQLSPTAQQDQKVLASQLYSALADLSTAVNTGQSDDQIKQKLQIVIARTEESYTSVEVSPSVGQVLPSPTSNDLNQALKEEETTLHGLLLHVDWSIQLAFTQQLGVLGDTIPTIANVTVGPPSNGTVLITLSGTGFVPQSELVIDGQVAGTVTNITSTQLIASVNQTNWSLQVHAVGIASPDGMANQFVVHESNSDDNHSGSDDNSHGTPTPVVKATQTVTPVVNATQTATPIDH